MKYGTTTSTTKQVNLVASEISSAFAQFKLVASLALVISGFKKLTASIPTMKIVIAIIIAIPNVCAFLFILFL